MPPERWGRHCTALALTENFLRVLVLRCRSSCLEPATRQQKWGLAVFVAGTVVYFASWVPLIVAPQSVRPPAVWVFGTGLHPGAVAAGLTLLGRHRLVWRCGYRSWMYAAPPRRCFWRHT